MLNCFAEEKNNIIMALALFLQQNRSKLDKQIFNLADDYHLKTLLWQNVQFELRQKDTDEILSPTELNNAPYGYFKTGRKKLHGQ